MLFAFLSFLAHMICRTPLNLRCLPKPVCVMLALCGFNEFLLRLFVFVSEVALVRNLLSILNDGYYCMSLSFCCFQSTDFVVVNPWYCLQRGRLVSSRPPVSVAGWRCVPRCSRSRCSLCLRRAPFWTRSEQQEFTFGMHCLRAVFVWCVFGFDCGVVCRRIPLLIAALFSGVLVWLVFRSTQFDLP